MSSFGVRNVATAVAFLVTITMPASALMMQPEIDFTSSGVPAALGLVGYVLVINRKRTNG